MGLVWYLISLDWFNLVAELFSMSVRSLSLDFAYSLKILIIIGKSCSASSSWRNTDHSGSKCQRCSCHPFSGIQETFCLSFPSCASISFIVVSEDNVSRLTHSSCRTLLSIKSYFVVLSGWCNPFFTGPGALIGISHKFAGAWFVILYHFIAALIPPPNIQFFMLGEERENIDPKKRVKTYCDVLLIKQTGKF